MTRSALVLFVVFGVFGCGNSTSTEPTSSANATASATAGGECGQTNSTKDLSVIDRSYDDVTGELACKDSPIEIYPSGTDAPDATGLVLTPSGTPIASGRTGNAFAEFSLSPGEYTVCLAYAVRSCGRVTLSDKHVYGTFTGGPRITWSASETPSQ